MRAPADGPDRNDEGGSRSVSGTCFRANPAYRLVPYDHLPEDIRARVEGLKNEPGFYGLLLSADESLAPKTVDDEAALLFYSLSQPGPVPHYLAARLGPEVDAAVTELVLDGVLQCGPGPDGPFVTGAEANAASTRDTGKAPARVAGGRIAELTSQALRYGASLRTRSVAELALRLYGYNAECASPERRRAFAADRGVPAYLRIDATLRHTLRAAGWRASEDVAEGWLYFGAPAGGSGAPYKLYVSPRFDALPEVFGAVARTAIDSRAIAFKVGADLTGLLRPDRIVVYCRTFEDLAAVADALGDALNGCPSRGVPFTAGIDSAGLLSWGMDPPADRRPPGMDQPESWRSWLTSRLAAALADARGGDGDVANAVHYARERLALAGVDTDSWTPRQAIWVGR